MDDTILSRIASSLRLFHEHKQTILDLRARVGKGKKPIDHFQIPKLEFMHGVVPSVISSGAVIQWSADTTKRVHITEVKVPSRSGNNQSYNPQICWWLNRSEKHRNFSLAISITQLLSSQAHDLFIFNLFLLLYPSDRVIMHTPSLPSSPIRTVIWLRRGKLLDHDTIETMCQN